jgi:hypothetical protein
VLAHLQDSRVHTAYFGFLGVLVVRVKVLS